MRAYKVSEINNYINKLLSTDFILSDVEVEGEISNFTHHYSGHMYFTLKDDSGKLKSVMFRSDNSKLLIQPETGMKVIARGNVSVYEKEGIYQLYVREMKESGQGDLYRKFLELKDKLDKEGLFDEKYKRELPKLPKKIGVVTSATGAAIRDIITVIKRRFSTVDILIYPSLVQGGQAPKSIIEGLKYLDNREDIDLIIFGRGGGSTEELFAFNDEDLARTIHGLKTPNISAVGHEVDFSISDFVADKRAATPSAAAEIAVPSLDEYRINLISLKDSLIKAMDRNLLEKRSKVEQLSSQLKLNSPIHELYNNRQNLDNIYRKIQNEIVSKSNKSREGLREIKYKIDYLNPQKRLESGYGIILNKDGKVVSSINDINEDDDIDIYLKDGRVKSKVETIEKVDKDGN